MAKRGLLLVNLGSPEAPTPKAVSRYLKEFLTDKYVIDLPWPVRQVLVRGIIAPFRSPKSAHAYEQVWMKEGSPLLHFTRGFAERVARELAGQYEVRWAMRYGQPSIASQIKDWDVEQIQLVPLYPQYAESSSRTVIEKAAHELGRDQHKRLQYLQDFFAEPEFITSVAEQIRTHAATFKPDHLLLSFHGLPEHHVQKLHPSHCLKSTSCCDTVSANNRFCYRAQAFATARAIFSQLEWPQGTASVGFQSRLGRRPWIQPYTDELVTQLAKKGVKRILVSCPSFVADCLETLEEVKMRLKEQFIEEGGEDLQLVPAVNFEDHWVKRFSVMVKKDSLVWQSYRKI